MPEPLAIALPVQRQPEFKFYWHWHGTRRGECTGMCSRRVALVTCHWQWQWVRKPRLPVSLTGLAVPVQVEEVHVANGGMCTVKKKPIYVSLLRLGLRSLSRLRVEVGENACLLYTSPYRGACSAASDGTKTPTLLELALARKCLCSTTISPTGPPCGTIGDVVVRRWSAGGRDLRICLADQC